MTNRILQFMTPHHCPRCSEHSAARDMRRRVRKEVHRIERLAGGAIQFSIPSTSWFAGTVKPPTDDPPLPLTELRLWIATNGRAASRDEDLTEYTGSELRRIAAELLEAADAVEGGVAC